MTKTTDIRSVRNAEDLIGYFAGQLGWNIDVDDFDSVDDFSYEFTADDLGLNPESFTKIRSLRQLRPFDPHQKWGLFCIEFDSGKFEVSALRKVLSGLIPRRRKDPNAPVWNRNDILFLCDWGETANRTIGLAHFEEHEKGLPQIKTISCTPSSNMADPKELKTFEERLSGLAWPKDAADVNAWSESWSSAFTTTYRYTIKKSAELTLALAEVAVGIRKRILDIMSVENQYGHVHLLWRKFRSSLVADMTKEQFADMYAQTMVYGLFSARCMDKTPEDFSVEEAIDCIPTTNPFLKNLMQASLGVCDPKNRLGFDELEIGDIVDLLLHTDMTEIVQDFGRQSGGGKEDPVLYFYEGFAKAYDAQKKIKCGEFYTPVPVVNFIVRAVDDILKRDFGYADGLATTATKKVKYMRESKRLVNGSRTKVEDEKEVPAVQILDVATGTGTFLRQTILRIYENFKKKHAGTPPDALCEAWNVYVANQLLPRLYGFELNMAPYAVAHMKLAMALKDTGYDFRGNERLRVYLTNSLEAPGNADAQTEFWEDPLAAESIAANAAKKNTGINVVIGNPPYNGESKNQGSWIMRLMEDYKKEPGGVIRLDERNSKWINDDYVKFLRLGQEYLTTSGEGVLAYICPHGFIDNPTFRGMRWKLLKTFDAIYILNLHGNVKKREKCPDGSKDENVFDIEQGVSINILVKHSSYNAKTGHYDGLADVYYADLWGLRDDKYGYLTNQHHSSIEWNLLSPQHDMYFLAPKNFDEKQSYEHGFLINDLMPVNGIGITSKRDDVAFQFSRQDIQSVVHDYSTLAEADVKVKYAITSESNENLVSAAMENVKEYVLQGDFVRKAVYRPFDNKWTFYTDRNRGFLSRPAYKVMKHFALGENIGLISGRQGQAVGEIPWNLSFVTVDVVDLNVFYRGGGCTFPLYIYDENMGKFEKRANFDPAIYAKICEAVGGQVTPEDVFHYIYAVLHTPEYRTKYKEFLKIDFPRIPYPKNADSFRALAKIGTELVATHLLKSEAVQPENLRPDIAVFGGAGNGEVMKISYDGDVHINASQTFKAVPETAWNFFIGGYQPAQKWLKDRKGRTLSDADVTHYRQIIHALLETDRLMHDLSALSGTWM